MAGKRRRRFAERRLDGLRDEPRPGAPRRDDDIADVIRRTRNAAGRCPPCAPGPERRASTPQAFRLKPHRSETFKPSKDPLFVGAECLYLARRAPVLSVESRDRAQPLPTPRTSGAANPRAQRHDLAGPRRRCRQGDRQVLPPLPQRGIPQVPQLRIPPDIHMDNYATRKTEPAGSPGAHACTSTAPRPRGQVERFFGLLTEKQPRRDVHRSTADLERAFIRCQRRPETVPLDRRTKF